MNKNIYDIDFAKIVRWWTPAPLRKYIWLTFLRVLIYPLNQLYQFFLLYRTAKIYQLKITPQKCYLQILLRDRWDFTLRRIYIDDALDKPPFYIFEHAELKPKYIRRTSEALPKYIYTSGESGVLRDDFIIFVPIDIAFEQAEMISLVKNYKLAGTKFKIQRY